MSLSEPATGRRTLFDEAFAALSRGRGSFTVSYEELTATMLELAVQGGRLDLAGELFDDLAAEQLGGPAPPARPATIQIEVTKNGHPRP